MRFFGDSCDSIEWLSEGIIIVIVVFGIFAMWVLDRKSLKIGVFSSFPPMKDLGTKTNIVIGVTII